MSLPNWIWKGVVVEAFASARAPLRSPMLLTMTFAILLLLVSVQR